MLRLARVLKTYPGDGAADIAFYEWGHSGQAARVPIMSGMAGGDVGHYDVPDIDRSATEDADGEREMIAVVAEASGGPLIIGFVSPPKRQGRFADGRMVYRHQSDVYTTIDKQGNAELSHPSGTYIRIGEGETHHDLSGSDVDRAWAIRRNTATAPTITIGQADSGTIKSTITITPSGAVTIATEDTATIKADGAVMVETKDTATIKAVGAVMVETQATAAIQATGNVTVTSQGSASIQTAGDVSVLAQGETSIRSAGATAIEAGGAATVAAMGALSLLGAGGLSLIAGNGVASCLGTLYVNGSVIATGDMVANGISLLRHSHIDTDGDVAYPPHGNF